MLNLIDEVTQECLAIRIDRKIRFTDVIDVLGCREREKIVPVIRSPWPGDHAIPDHDGFCVKIA